MKKYLAKYLVLAMVVVVAGLLAYYFINPSTSLKFSSEETSVTPAHIDKVLEIGEWEFLTVRDEEIADTTAYEKRIWPLPDKKKQLARIYTGTLRIGFDLKKDTKPDWIKTKGDTAIVKLPKTRLLDERFIDEAATRPLIEEGKWTHSDRAALTAQAALKMKKQVLTPETLAQADTTARVQLTALLRSLGYTTILYR